nr:MAG TPA: hypothetical protein [Caudoviricetes sp.]
MEERQTSMKVRYIGESFGVDSLTDGKVYTCIAVEDGAGLCKYALRIIDDSGEDYLYSSLRPGPLDRSSPGGRWEIIEDDEHGTLARVTKP